MTDVRYRIIERVGADASEWVWMEVDAGWITTMPRHYGVELTREHAEKIRDDYNSKHSGREMQLQDSVATL